MFKRTAAVILTACFIIPVLISAGSVVFAPKTPFDFFDRARERAIEDAVSPDIPDTSAESTVLGEDNRYIIKFKDSVSLEAIEAVLGETEYSLLAESEARLFAVSLKDSGFTEAYGDIIEYYESDNIRNSLATVNDPSVMNTVYESYGIYNAWDTVTGNEDIIVAVLDTGVARNHEDLAEVNVLSGYDAVSRKAGVTDDSSGHGTGVTGIIAATADNGLGIAGVAHGVTILPVKVSASSTTIYSSDLVSGIRFAADAGAKIINMSIGGYSSSFAEQEAVNYALSKGCILISAAGNGGNTEYADQKSYPASYEGVISVASCNESGERSSFSQYNDAVDVAAIGENIIMPMIAPDGGSIYRTDSGTSFSCAFVSGIAALAASYIGDDARFESREFLALITEACGDDRDDYLGYGVINAESLVSIADEPIITGVTDGGYYSESVRISFNRGTATLNGEAIEDGETVVANGEHELTVTDGEFEKRLDFRLDYTPLSYEFEEFASYAYFSFTRGTATLDGFPYNSEDRITVSGRHEFILVDGDEKISKTINLRYALPSVFGVEDGKTYNQPIEISIIGDGTATLDGNEVQGEITVAESGAHVLHIESGNGAVSENYRFSIDFAHGRFADTDYAGGKAAVDEENGYICLYGDSLVGARIYDISAPEKYIHFLPVGRIYSHAFHGENLILMGDGGITVVDRKTAVLGQESIINSFDPAETAVYAYGDGHVMGFGNGNMYVIDLETGMAALVAELGYILSSASYCNGYVYTTSTQYPNSIFAFNLTTGENTEYNLGIAVGGAQMCFGDGYISIGNRLYNSDNFDFIMEFSGQRAVRIENGLIYTESRIINISNSKTIGSLPFPVSDIFSGEENNYLFGINPQCGIISREAEGIRAFGAATYSDRVLSLPEVTNEYRTDVYYNTHTQPISVASSESMLYMLFADRYALYRMQISDKTEQSSLPLHYKPSKVIFENGYIAVSFANVPMIFIAPEENFAEGRYITLPDIYGDITVLGGRIYTVINGRITVADITAGAVTATELPAQYLANNGERLYILNGNTVSAYDAALNNLNSDISVTAGTKMYIGNGIAVSRAVYNTETREPIGHFDSKILAFSGNTVVTESGVYNLETGGYIGTPGIYSPKFVTVGGDNSVIAIGGGLISSNTCLDGDEVVVSPTITGIESFGVYLSNAVISYDHGIGYLDGKPFESGNTAEGVGSHIFSLALPCGRNISIPFTVQAPLSGIDFLLDQRTISVGEAIDLRVIYLPDGAGSIPVTFKSDGEGLLINEAGEATALAVGKYTVTATAVTENGNFETTAVITVRDDLIAPLPESGITVDRDNMLIQGIPVGTDVKAFLGMLANSSTVAVLDSDGNSVRGYVGTGHRIVLLDSNGKVSDELYAVVSGDTDGDGILSAYDMYQLERILKGYEYSAPYTAAADMNQNGIVADNDFRILKRILFGRSEGETGTPEAGHFASCTVQTVSSIESGDIIDVAVCLNGSKYALAAYGILNYSEGLEFIEFSSDWDADCYDHGDKIAFYAYDGDGNTEGTAFKVLINLRFRVAAAPSTKAALWADSVTVSYTDGCETVPFKKAELDVLPRVYNDFRINFVNGDEFEFDPEIHEYSVTIPYDSALADIYVTHRMEQEVTIPSLVIPSSGEETIVITYNDDGGSTEFYNITVTREEEPDFDTNCRLKSLEIEGHRLTPVFDPDYYEYAITVPYGTEKINVYCHAQSSAATVHIGDTDLTDGDSEVEITVGALNGETLTYTINVSVLPKPVESAEESIEESDGENGSDGSNPDIIMILTIAVIAVIALTVIAIVIKLKRKIS